MNISSPGRVEFQLGELAALVAAPAEALDALPAAVYVCDADGRIVRFNQHAVQLWGRAPASENVERYCGGHRLYYPDGRPLPKAETPMAEAIRNGLVTTDQEVVIERPDGSRITAAVNIRPLRDKSGGIEGAINCFQDITARKALEEEHRRTRDSLEDFFENGAVGLHIVSGEGIILRANKAELEMLGYTAEEYVGRPITDFHADADVISDILTKLSCGERLQQRSARLKAKDGSIKHVLITSTGRFVDGRLVGTRCFTVDVTDERRLEEDLRERERRQRELLEALPAAIYTTDREGRITYFNQAAIDFSGRVPQIGTDKWCTTWRLLDTNGAPLAHEDCPMAVSLREGRPIRGAEAIAERPDGTRVPFIPYPTPLRDEAGNIIGAVNMLVDISARKAAETRQKILIDELNHRVKNTLATVQSLAASTTGSAESVEVFVKNFTERLSSLARAHDLLTQTSWQGVEINELLCELLKPYDRGTERIKIHGPSFQLGARKAIALTMAIGELATNAAKYGSLSAESGRLEVSWSEADGQVQFHWAEREGPPVGQPKRRGFGTRLIERVARTELGGAIDVVFHPLGVRCGIAFPLQDVAP